MKWKGNGAVLARGPEKEPGCESNAADSGTQSAGRRVEGKGKGRGGVVDRKAGMQNRGKEKEKRWPDMTDAFWERRRGVMAWEREAEGSRRGAGDRSPPPP